MIVVVGLRVMETAQESGILEVGEHDGESLPALPAWID